MSLFIGNKHLTIKILEKIMLEESLLMIQQAMFLSQQNLFHHGH